MRLVINKGAITPEFTQALLGAVAPDIINLTRDIQQQDSVAPIPPELDKLLDEANAPTAEAVPEDTAAPITPLAEPEAL
jgi:hypothetical protein